MVFAVNPGADGANNSFANFQATALAIGAQLAANATNTTNTTTASGSGSSSKPSSTGGLGGSSSNGAISMNSIYGTNAMLIMTGLGMVFSLLA
jgi:hypothetical protein